VTEPVRRGAVAAGAGSPEESETAMRTYVIERALTAVGAAAPVLLLGGAILGCRSERAPKLLLDVHHLQPGVTLDAVADAHAKDLAVEGRHGVHYERYWVDEGSGTVYCLVRAPSAEAAEAVHREAHGLVADEIHEVQEGILPAAPSGERRLFMDTHEVGPGVRPEDVAEAHRKDLAVEGGHGVHFLEYWVDPSGGQIHCLAEAASAQDVIETHREAHGMLPTEIHPVVAGR
jgi:Nickel responsive protein SCO4226-like